MNSAFPSRVVAIGGVSRAGKTSAALALVNALANFPVRVFHLDDFVFPENQIPKILDHTDWEIPESTDFDKLYREVSLSAALPGITVVEGLFPFFDPRLVNLYHKAVYLSISFREFYLRKCYDKRWGAEPPWYMRYIWISHFKHGLPPAKLENKILHITDYEDSWQKQLVSFVLD